jgi:phosphoserine aminotransferase
LYSEEDSTSQLNLIKAADKAGPAERFIPSEYSFIQTEEYANLTRKTIYRSNLLFSLLPHDPSIKLFLDAANLLKSTSLQFTRVIPGFFMDYWAMPHVQSHLEHLTFGVDMTSCTAVIPGDGNDKIGMTYTYDMAAFIAQLLERNDWDEFSVIIADEVTYNQLVQLGEEVRGRKFKVVYDNPEKVKEGNVTVPPQPESVGYSEQELVETTALVDRLVLAKVFDFPANVRANAKFPDLKLVKARELVTQAWEGKP